MSLNLYKKNFLKHLTIFLIEITKLLKSNTQLNDRSISKLLELIKTMVI